jgi:predicted anti-sigma-YlaC factor YlaD
MHEVPFPRAGDVDPPSVAVACREFVELVTEHLEGTLPDEVDRAIREHLALCDPCVQYLDQIRATASLLGDQPRPTLSPVVREELLDVYAGLHAEPPDERIT